MRKSLIIIWLVASASTAIAQQSGKSLMHEFGVDDPSIKEPACFTVSRGTVTDITIMVDQCTGDSWYLNTAEWRWHWIQRSAPGATH